MSRLDFTSVSLLFSVHDKSDNLLGVSVREIRRRKMGLSDSKIEIRLLRQGSGRLKFRMKGDIFYFFFSSLNKKSDNELSPLRSLTLFMTFLLF